MLKNSILILTGPTAAGKTALSLDIAQRIGGEIISADSRQVYRRMDIGTAKPSLEERRGIPHHLIDELEPGEPFSAGQFARSASERIRDVRDRGKVPIVVGGATLYLQALQYGLSDIPAIPAGIREELAGRLSVEGGEALFAELQRVDPESAARSDATKSQRIVRALEVYYGTGNPLSYYFHHKEPPSFSFTTFVLTRSRENLYGRIEARVDEMIAAGLIDEVQNLLASGVDPTWNAMQTIGYQEPLAYLRGDLTLDEMTQSIKQNTRRYAKRQLTWFRRFSEYEWLDLDASQEGIVDKLARVASSG